MQLVELHWIQTELYVSSRFQEERLVTLESYHLDGYVLHLIECIPAKLLHEELGIWLYLALCLQRPGIALGCEVGIVEIVVAIIH